MLTDETMTRFFTVPQIANLPVGQQGEVIKYIQAGLQGIKEDNENATISELFESTANQRSSFAESN